IAAVHCGWRGLAAGAPRIAIETLAREFDTSPSDVVAAIGPSIGPCCYEVGVAVHDAFEKANLGCADLTRWVLPEAQPTERNPSMQSVPAVARAHHWFFDAWTSTRDQLVNARVPSDRIFVAELCTASHPEAFCSYRRDGRAAGRNAAVIRCEPFRPSHSPD